MIPSAPAVAGRVPAPDIARGAMLLLIAIANVSYWTSGAANAPEAFTLIDRIWLLLRNGLVDGRAYPLFAALFGFGLATIAMRRNAGGADTVPARRLLRRRGWWLIAFGGVHALLFAGDIIGLYGLIAVVFAGWIARGRLRAMAVVGVIITSIFIVSTLGYDPQDTEMMLGGVGGGAGGGMPDLGIPWPWGNLGLWAIGGVLAIFASGVLPAVLAGVGISRTTWITDPDRHRRLLTAVAAGGLTVGFLASLPFGLYVSGFSTELPTGAWTVNSVGTFLSAAGWLALFALLGGSRSPEQPGVLRRVTTAVGQRSMTAYIGQTLIFLPVFWVLGRTGHLASLGPAATGGIAVLTWSVIAAVAYLLHMQGRRGPFEVALRHLIAR
ncbi:MAG: DUF418 domain-containing protein, partial [Actinomycetia bacterium]|nr:DUF418 domain-containing protein [Actinomycetes bacterium]